MKLAVKKQNINRPSDVFQWLFTAWFASTLLLTPNELCQILFPPVFQIIFLILLFLIITFTFSNQSKNKFRFDASVKVFLSGVVIYILGLVVAIGMSDDPYYNYSLYILGNRSNIFFCFVIGLLTAKEKLVKMCMDVYSNFLLVLSIMSLILFFIVGFTEIPALGDYTAFGERTYKLYPFGLNESVAGLGEILFPRAQSFYKEPGNFAMMLIPSLIWNLIGNQSLMKALIFFITILLTFSVGGWLTMIPVFALLSFKIKRSSLSKFKIYQKIFRMFGFIAFLTLVLTLFIAFSLTRESDWLIYYIVSKFLGEDGSQVGGERIQNLFDAYELFLDYPQGIGPGGLILGYGGFTLPPILYQAIEAGFLGALGYALVTFTIVSLAVDTFTKSKTTDETMIALAASVIALFCMSFQRGDPFGGYTTALLCSFFLRSYIEARKAINQPNQPINRKV